MTVSRPVITGRRGVITTGHYLATMAGQKAYALGGNAIDAGVAAGFALAVLKPQENSMGGECPILVHSPVTGKVTAISGQGTAPLAATIEWFRKQELDVIPGDGYLGAMVPALFGSYATALLHFGRLSLTEVLEPAAELAEYGFPVYRALRDSIMRQQERFLTEWPSTAEVFIPGGKVPEVGDYLRQPALGRTFWELIEAEKQSLAAGAGRESAIEAAIDYFYRGPVAERIVEFARNNPVRDASGKKHTALLTTDDFAAYQTRLEEPVAAEFHNYTVYKCGPWTQGPVFLQQLKLLEGFNLRELGHNTPAYVHTVVEAAKLAFADRERYYGDPEYVFVPLTRLLSKDYNQTQRERIIPGRAMLDPLWEKAMNDEMMEETYRGDTTHLDAADTEGYMISATPSGAWIPSSPVIPEIGFPLGTRGQMFNFILGHPNALAPGKRPRTTLTPSMAFKKGKPWMAFGTQGGDMQDQWTLQFFLNVAIFGMDMQEALDVPTFHTLHFPCSFYPHGIGTGEVKLEQGLAGVMADLKTWGHQVEIIPTYSNGQVCGVQMLLDGWVAAGASPKHDGQAYAGSW